MKIKTKIEGILTGEINAEEKTADEILNLDKFDLIRDCLGVLAEEIDKLWKLQKNK